MNCLPECSRLICGLILLSVAGLVAGDIVVADEKFFENKVRPLLVEYCYECHSAESDIPQGELRLDTSVGWLNGGATGAAVVPGDVDDSLLIEAVRYENDAIQMPPDGRLTDAEIAIFEQWVNDGAAAPEMSDAPQEGVRAGIDERIVEGRKFWAFHIDRTTPVPDVADSWAARPIDAFVLETLRGHDLKPNPAASKYELIRRATFDLIGLPPTPREVRDFIVDESPAAFATVVDRLLQSPHYGERWGRYWLDLARYSDTNGADENKSYAEAWRYRDYVVGAFNGDKPYDRFVLEQLAGDLLPVAGDAVQERHDNLTATGFLVLGPKMLAEQDKEKLVMDLVDEQLDTIGRTFMGLTLGCCRCHDHKFDPIAAEDYYALAGVFRSTKTMANLDHVSEWNEHQLLTAELTAAKEKFEQTVQPTLDKMQQQIDEVIEHEKKRLRSVNRKLPDGAEDLEKLFEDSSTAKLKQLRSDVENLEQQRPVIPSVMAVDDGDVEDIPVHIRGNHLTLGEKSVPRGVPQVFAAVVDVPDIPADQSGRLELAKWLTRPEHPLTSRVMVNRIWQGHFGIGLVESASNFGLRGDPPTHPELLDWLAAEFIRRDWSIKGMHRLIMLSNAYQMSVVHTADAAQADPENRLLWRQNRRRLEAEPLRDALLAVSGNLDRTTGGSLVKARSNEYSRINGEDVYGAPRRAIYLPVVRNRNYEMFTIFDYSNPGVHVGRRSDTIVAQQALFLLNSDFVAEQAQSLAESLLHQESLSDQERVDELYLRLYARPVTEAEAEIACRFLENAGSPATDASDFEIRISAWSGLAHALMAANEFVYVN